MKGGLDTDIDNEPSLGAAKQQQLKLQHSRAAQAVQEIWALNFFVLLLPGY